MGEEQVREASIRAKHQEREEGAYTGKIEEYCIWIVILLT